MISVDEARASVLQHTRAGRQVTVDITRALGCTLAADVTSDIDVPPYDKALMDGYALRADDVAANNQPMRVIEEVIAGSWPQQQVAAGTAIRIMTGAPLPTGADTVIRFEDTTATDESGVNVFSENAAVGLNILRRGSIVKQGDIVLTRGKCLSGVDIGVLAEVGANQVPVCPAPSVAVLATGNELTPVGELLELGQIRNSNGPMLCGLVEQVGAVPHDLGIGRDERDRLETLIRTGLEHDVCLISGGVSVGVKDLVPDVLKRVGVQPVFHKVRLKPGKPLWFGVLPRSDGPTTLVFGLPGNPVSSLVCFWLFVRPALAALSGGDPNVDRIRSMQLAASFTHRGDRPTYYPGQIVTHGAQPVVDALPWQGSADLFTVAHADCLIHFPAGEHTYNAGDAVECLSLRL